MRGSIVVAALLGALLVAPLARAEDDAGYFTANGLLNRGLFDLAAKEYERFLDEHADHRLAPDARYGLGVALFRQARYPEVLRVLTATPPPPDFVRAVETATMIGQAYLLTGKPREAVAALASIPTAHPKHELADDAAALLAEASYHARDYERIDAACAWLEKSAAKSPHRDRAEHFRALAAMAANEYDVAARRFLALRARYPQSSLDADRRMMLAQCLHHAGDPRTESLYREVMDRGRAEQKALALRGLATWHHQRGDLDSARTALESLLEDHPGDPGTDQTRWQLGSVLFSQGVYAAAEKAFVAAARGNAIPARRAAYWRAKCALRQDEPARAAALLEPFADADGELGAEIAYDLGVALVRAGDDEDGGRQLIRFSVLFPRHTLHADALHLAATALHRAETFEASETAALRFLDAHPDDPRAASVMVLLGEAARRDGRNDEAIARYREVLTADAAPDVVADAELRLGLLLARAGAYEDALPHLTRAARRPDVADATPFVLLALGDAHFQLEGWPDAARWLAAYLDTTSADGGAEDVPALDDALLKLGIARFRAGDAEGAIPPLLALTTRFPESPHGPRALFEIGQAYLALDRGDDAVPIFEALLETDAPESILRAGAVRLGALYRQLGDHTEAADLFGRAAEGAPADEAADALARRAEALFAAGDLSAAASAYDDLLERHPDHPRTHGAAAWRALARARSGTPDTALAELEGVLAEPESVPAELEGALHYERAWALRRLNRPDEAIAAYGAVLAHPAGDTPVDAARWERAELLANAGRHAEALRDLDPAGASADRAIDLAYRRARSLHALGEDAKALEALAPVLAAGRNAGPLHVPAALLAGECERNRGAHAKAAVHFELVRKESRDPATIRAAGLRLGESQLALQRWAAAETTFRTWLERWPKDELWFQARFGLGQAQENQGKHDAAIASYETVTARHRGATAARAQFQIGECLFASERYEEAIRAFVQVDVLHNVPEWTAAALYESGRCLAAMGRSAEARTQLASLRERFPDSSWSTLAAARLRELEPAPPPGHTPRDAGAGARP